MAQVFCQECCNTHPSDAAIAVGRFEHNGPSGFIANGVPGALLRSTRSKATADYCEQQRKGFSANSEIPNL